MSSQMIAIQDTFKGYLAKPASGSGAGIVIIQEIFGVNHFVREVADQWAQAGYFALAPDLFWRIEPGIELTDKSEAEWKRAFELFGLFDQDAGVNDIQTSIDLLRRMPGCTGKVGTIGFCLGGLMAYLSAARTSSDGSVGYYGVSIDQRLAEAVKIKKPLVLHIAGKDQFVDAAAQQRMHQGLAGNSLVTLYDYPDQDHAFARTGGAHYDKASADLARQRTADFFKKALN